mgnify:FL=1|jgi:uncharacterized membrane protein
MPKNKYIISGLLISLALNLLFIGAISYRYINPQNERTARPLPPNIGWVVRDLDQQRRDELGPVMQQSAQVIAPVRREMLVALRRVNELISAQAFDMNALSDAFAELREANIRYQTLSHEQTTTILGELSEQERQVALDFVKRRGPRDGRDGFRDREKGPRFGGPGEQRHPPIETLRGADQ